MKILKQEDKDTRIIQYGRSSRWWIFDTGIRIGRQRKINGRWMITASLYTDQCKTLEGYINYFNYYEHRTIIGVRKQF